MGQDQAAMETVAERRRLAESRGRRAGFIALGHLCVALAVIGAFLPVMPTTVFLIAAASCYARGSTRFHHRLLASRTFGPVIRDWETHRAMSPRAKAVAIGMIVVAFGLTIGLAVHSLWARIVYGAIGLGLVGWIVRIRRRVDG